MLTLVIAHATLGTPIVASVVFARVMGRDRSLEDAARDLGARPLRVLLTVTVPLAAPGILSGWLLALTLSFDDVVTSSFLAGPENTTLPMAIFSGLRVGLDPQINAVGTLMVVGVAAIAAVFHMAVRVGVWTRRARGRPGGAIGCWQSQRSRGRLSPLASPERQPWRSNVQQRAAVRHHTNRPRRRPLRHVDVRAPQQMVPGERLRRLAMQEPSVRNAHRAGRHGAGRQSVGGARRSIDGDQMPSLRG